MISNSYVANLFVFAGISGLLYVLLLCFKNVSPRLQARLRELNNRRGSESDRRDGSDRRTDRHGSAMPSTKLVADTLKRIGDRVMPKSDAQRSDQQMKLIQAGIYSSSALSILSALKIIMTVLPPLVGLLLSLLGLVSLQRGLLIGGLLGGVGLILPGLWLDRKKYLRQKIIRQSLPDFLDLLIVCLESGLSFESSLQRVTDELKVAHPLLAGELSVLQREITLGRTTDEALQNLTARTDLDVIKTLTRFVSQARRFGIGMAETLRVHVDILRSSREQRAEELAQKASVKVLFPTLLFIFPAVFVILIGPAAIQIYEGMLK